MVSVSSQSAPRRLYNVGSRSACIGHHCAPLKGVLDPHMVTLLQEWHVVCSVTTVVVLFLLLSVCLFSSFQIVHVCPAWVKLGWDDRDRCSNLSAHEELCWTVSIRQRCGAVGHEAKVRITGFLQDTFDCPYGPLCLSVALWEVWAGSDMAETPLSRKLSEVLRCKLWPIV